MFEYHNNEKTSAMENQADFHFSDLIKDLDESVFEHNKFAGIDGTVYNSTTILTILLTSTAALMPEICMFYLKFLSGIAAILIAVDRSMNWGARWIYHRRMRNKYLNILAKISFYENMPATFSEEERKVHYLEIYTELFNIRQKEISMPRVKAES